MKPGEPGSSSVQAIVRELAPGVGCIFESMGVPEKTVKIIVCYSNKNINIQLHPHSAKVLRNFRKGRKSWKQPQKGMMELLSLKEFLILI